MKNPTNSGYDDLDDLLRQVDELVSDPVPGNYAQGYDNSAENSGGYDDGAYGGAYDDAYGGAYDDEDDDAYDDGAYCGDSDGPFDPDDYAPADCGDDSVLYQNYSNHYGADIRNYSNGYGGGPRSVPRPEPDPEPQPVIPAYNADFRRAPREEPDYVRQYRDPPEPRRATRSQQAVQKHQPRPPREKRRRRRGGCGCTTLIVLLLVLGLALFGLYRAFFRAPVSDQSIGERKKDAATILICGTDLEGTRTDTMMLCYLNGSDREVGLLSLPRDTYTITSGGNAAKLNSAYGRNGTGREGMEGLLDYVQEIIGYRPDGYVLVSMDLVTQIVDLMGGLEVEVPMTFDLEGIHLEEGLQHLDGTEVLQLLRFRSGYAMQDLGRIEVQRTVLKAAMQQWASPGHIKDVFGALKLVENHSQTTLKIPNCLWAAKVLLTGMKNFSTNTLPGYATYIDGVSYYVLDREQVADLINTSYNPYQVEIRPENLKIAG